MVVPIRMVLSMETGAEDWEGSCCDLCTHACRTVICHYRSIPISLSTAHSQNPTPTLPILLDSRPTYLSSFSWVSLLSICVIWLLLTFTFTNRQQLYRNVGISIRLFIVPSNYYKLGNNYCPHS